MFSVIHIGVGHLMRSIILSILQGVLQNPIRSEVPPVISPEMLAATLSYSFRNFSLKILQVFTLNAKILFGLSSRGFLGVLSEISSRVSADVP